jgi:hypothetical protein
MKKSLLLNPLIPAVIFVTLTAGLLFPSASMAQKAEAGISDTTKAAASLNQKTGVKSYPMTVGYLSFIIPFFTIDRTGTTPNFNGTTKIGFPVGVNVLYSDKFGFSYEFTPTIASGKGVSKTSSLLFDPGTMFRFQHGFTFISRLAFETSGRYGFTPVFNQVYAHTQAVNYFVALSTPARFGNSQPASIGLNLQLGFTFN